MKNKALILSLFTVVFTVCMFSGCQKGDRVEGLVPVDGTVVYKGQPLPGAIVSFEPMSGTGFGASCRTDAQGRFRLTTRHPGDGAMPGEYRVSVDKRTVHYMPTEEEAEAYYAKTRKTLEPKISTDVPEKYRRAETSGFQFTVPQEGLRNISVELKD